MNNTLLLANGDSYPLPQQLDPGLFPQVVGPAISGSNQPEFSQLDNLIELFSLMGLSLAEGSPVMVAAGLLYLYTRFIQGKPFFKKG